MNLIQSICCFFSSRCASGAADPKKADQDGDVQTRDAGTPPPPPRPATPETEDFASHSALNLPAGSRHCGKQTRDFGKACDLCRADVERPARQRTALPQPYLPRTQVTRLTALTPWPKK